jgi:hypothetical protein
LAAESSSKGLANQVLQKLKGRPLGGLFCVLISPRRFAWYRFGHGEIIDTSADFWGFGVVQDIDAAAMKFYAALRYWESEIQVALPDDGPVGQDVQIENFLTIAVGGRIYF